MRVAMVVMNDMSFDQRVHREASALGEAGHEVVVFCMRSEGLPAVESREGYEVRRVADLTTAGWRRPHEKIGQMRRRTAALAREITRWSPDVVHAHDSDTLAAAWRAAHAAHAKFVYDAHELFPDQFVGEGVGSIAAVRWWWRAVERRYIPRADAALTVSPGLAQLLHERFGVEATVVRNAPKLRPLERSDRLRRELGLGEGTAIMLYQGLLLPERGLVPLVRAMEHVDGAVLVIQGTGSEESAMREAATAGGLGDRVRFMGWVPPEDSHEYATGADIGVVIYEATTLNNRLAGPNKLFVYLMAGLPIAARDFPGPRDIVVGEQVGDVFEFATAESIAATLNRMLSDRASLAETAVRARRLAETTYNWDAEKTVLIGVYEGLGASHG